MKEYGEVDAYIFFTECANGEFHAPDALTSHKKSPCTDSKEGCGGSPAGLVVLECS